MFGLTNNGFGKRRNCDDTNRDATTCPSEETGPCLGDLDLLFRIGRVDSAIIPDDIFGGNPAERSAEGVFPVAVAYWLRFDFPHRHGESCWRCPFPSIEEASLSPICYSVWRWARAYAIPDIHEELARRYWRARSDRCDHWLGDKHCCDRLRKAPHWQRGSEMKKEPSHASDRIAHPGRVHKKEKGGQIFSLGTLKQKKPMICQG